MIVILYNRQDKAILWATQYSSLLTYLKRVLEVSSESSKGYYVDIAHQEDELELLKRRIINNKIKFYET